MENIFMKMWRSPGHEQNMSMFLIQRLTHHCTLHENHSYPDGVRLASFLPLRSINFSDFWKICFEAMVYKGSFAGVERHVEHKDAHPAMPLLQCKLL